MAIETVLSIIFILRAVELAKMWSVDCDRGVGKSTTTFIILQCGNIIINHDHHNLWNEILEIKRKCDSVTKFLQKKNREHAQIL